MTLFTAAALILAVVLGSAAFAALAPQVVDHFRGYFAQRRLLSQTRRSLQVGRDRDRIRRSGSYVLLPDGTRRYV